VQRCLSWHGDIGRQHPSWANDTEAERMCSRVNDRLGKFCGDHSGRPMSWATKFFKVVNI